MKRIILMVLFLAGCVSNPGVVELSPGTYMLSRVDHGGIFGNEATLQANVINEANAFAKSKGKVALAVSTHLDPMWPGHFASFQYQFRLVDPSDQAEHSPQTISLECKDQLRTSDLDPIRFKVELSRDSLDSAVPFAIATNDTFPSQEERVAISKWATLREACLARQNAALSLSPTATPLQVTQVQQDRSFLQSATAGVGDLIVALYQQKLTYGEFARKRYEITRDAAEAERQYRESRQLGGQQQQIQMQQLAQQQYANRLAAWGTYMQAVNARQPQAVHLDGTITVLH
jgi:hypothetical protein